MKRGEVYRFNLDPTIGSEIRKTRPCVVVQRDAPASPIVIVCPLTDANGRLGNLLNPAVRAGVGGMTKDSRVVTHQIRALDRRRVVGASLGTLSPAIMAAVDAGLRAVLDL